MPTHPDLPAFILDCEGLTHKKFMEVLELPAYFLQVFVYIQEFDEDENISLLLILADSRGVACNFARDLGQRARPVPIKRPSANDQ